MKKTILRLNYKKKKRIKKLDNLVSFQCGLVGLKSTDTFKIKKEHLESFRKSISRYIKNYSKAYVKIFPQTINTAKSLGVRMGGGKGKNSYNHYLIKPGALFFELGLCEYDFAGRILKVAAKKLPVNTCFVKLNKTVKSRKIF